MQRGSRDQHNEMPTYVEVQFACSGRRESLGIVMKGADITGTRKHDIVNGTITARPWRASRHYRRTGGGTSWPTGESRWKLKGVLAVYRQGRD